MKTISVIIPTYNRLKTLDKVIGSYIRQSNVKEIIIVDDCSNDGTEEYIEHLIKKNPLIKYSRNSTNSGAPYSRNRAISMTDGDLVFIGEDDLELTNSCLETLVDHMSKSKADIIAGRRLWMQKGETKRQCLARVNKYFGTVFNKRLLITNCEINSDIDMESPLLDASMLISKKVLKKIRYDEYYRRNSWREETDLQLSALSQGFKLVHCPHAVSYHLYKEKDIGGNHSQSLLKYEINVWLNNLYMTEKYWPFLKSRFGITKIFYFRFLSYRILRILSHKYSSLKNKIIRSQSQQK